MATTAGGAWTLVAERSGSLGLWQREPRGASREVDAFALDVHSLHPWRNGELVGLILNGAQAEQVLQEGRADLVAIGREALKNPFWALHAAEELGADDFSAYPQQYGSWLDRRLGAIRGVATDPELAALPPLTG